MIRSVHKIIGLLILSAVSCTAVGANARNEAATTSISNRRPGMRTLNNMVIELLSKKSPDVEGRCEWSFTNPHEGWVFFRSTAEIKGGDPVSVTVDSIPSIITHNAKGIGDLEAMRYLSKGKHTIKARCEGRSSLDAIVVRSVPELFYCQYPGGPHVSQYGAYDWEFLQKHVLRNVNCIVASDFIVEKHVPQIEEWKTRGGKWVFAASVPGNVNDPTPIVDQSYKYWHEHPGFKHPMIDGIIVDEFVWGEDDPRFEGWSEAIDRIYRDEKCKNKVFYAWTAGPPMYAGERSRAFAQSLMRHGGKIALELYLSETPTEAEADSAFQWMRDEVVAWDKAIPNAHAHLIATLGYMSQPPESLDVDPTVDFKVFLDRQMHALANDPAFSGLYGFMYYLSPYADEETVRWSGRLFRHYCIEGKKDMLSDGLGFRYHLDHLTNPDFDDGLNGWTASPAEAGSIKTGHMDGWSWLQGRYPQTARGDNFLLARRSAKRPNSFSQEIRNLKPGRLYSLKMFTGDYQDMIKERSVSPERHAVSINVDNAELVAEKCFDQVLNNCYSHHLGKFNDAYKAFMVYHWRVFRAKGTTAKLTISDWDSGSDPGGPIGQELMYNFVEIQPYYSE